MKRQRTLLIKPIHVLAACSLLLCSNFVYTFHELGNDLEVMSIEAELTDDSYGNTAITEMQDVALHFSEYLADATNEATIEKLDTPTVYSTTSRSTTIMELAYEGLSEDVALVGSSTSYDVITTSTADAIQAGSSECAIVESIIGDIDVLASKYVNTTEYPEWDTYQKFPVVDVMWEFLVNQQGVPAENAAGILGSIYYEGRFGQQQKTDLCIANIEQARILLGAGQRGYGICQWTSAERQDDLLSFYEAANTYFSDDWTKVKIAAECLMLLQEIQDYDVFVDLYTPTTIEDATGRVARLYEGYNNSWNEWSVYDSKYYCVDTDSNGGCRYKMAQTIYDYYMK